MSSKPPRLDSGLGREILVVLALTVVGAVLRLWSPGRLGLVHFDEGIYALAGLWVFSPRGLQDFDPTAVAYAPPGFPILEGISYLGLGVGDFSAILVSIVAGTLTIPAAAWVARRTFGAGAGGAAAALRRTVGSAHCFFADGAHRRIVSSCSGCWRSARGSGFSNARIRLEPSGWGSPLELRSYLNIMAGFRVLSSRRPRPSG